MSIEKVKEISKKIVRNIEMQSNLKNYSQLVEQANTLSEAFWDAGLKTTLIYDFLKEVNRINRIPGKDFQNKIKPNLRQLVLKLQAKSNDYEIIKIFQEIIEKAITKVADIKDFKCLIQLVDLAVCIEEAIVRNMNIDNLKDYKIRQLIKDSENFGYYLNLNNLKTNQIRKFLDTVNRLKNEISVKLREKNNEVNEAVLLEELSPKIYNQVVLLKQKISYAAAREESAIPLKEVMDIAIDKVHDTDDFERLFQLVESIIAYHKAAGGA